MDQFRSVTANLNDLIQVLVGVFDELVNCFLVSEDAVLLLVLKHAEVGFAWHQKSSFDDVNQAESKEV